MNKQFHPVGLPVILFNPRGFWDALLAQFDEMVREEILSPSHRVSLKIAGHVSDLDALLKTEPLVNGLCERYWEKKTRKE